MRCAPVTDLARARLLLACLAFRPQKIPIKHIVNQGRFSRTGNAGDAGENAERNFDIEVLEIVFGRAGDFDQPMKTSSAILESGWIFHA